MVATDSETIEVMISWKRHKKQHQMKQCDETKGQYRYLE